MVGYPDKEFRDKRANSLNLELEALKLQGESLNREVQKIQLELEALKYLNILDEEK